MINFALSGVFAVEMLLKLYALGFDAYFRDRFNVFDAVVVLVSAIEISISPPDFVVPGNGDSNGGAALSGLRTFRIVRVLKLARSLVSLRVLLETILRSLQDVANFALLLFLFIYIFSLLGQFLFANRFRFDPRSGDVVRLGTSGFDEADVPRENFDDFLSAFVSIFSILMVEAWPSILFSGWRAAKGQSDAFEVIAVLYFVVVVVVGNLVLLSLFLAILLSNFEGLDEEMSNASERLRRKALGQDKHGNVRGKKKTKRTSGGMSPNSDSRGIPIYSEDGDSTSDSDGSVRLPFDPALLSSSDSDEYSDDDAFYDDLVNAPGSTSNGLHASNASSRWFFQSKLEVDKDKEGDGLRKRHSDSFSERPPVMARALTAAGAATSTNGPTSEHSRRGMQARRPSLIDMGPAAGGRISPALSQSGLGSSAMARKRSVRSNASFRSTGSKDSGS